MSHGRAAAEVPLVRGLRLGMVCCCCCLTRRRFRLHDAMHLTRRRFRWALKIVPISTEATIGRLSRLWWLGHALFAGCQSLCLPSLHLCLSVCSSAFGLWISVLWIAENPTLGRLVRLIARWSGPLWCVSGCIPKAGHLGCIRSFIEVRQMALVLDLLVG